MNNYTRNRDLSFWDEERRHSNCGSFALNIQEWVIPCEEEERDYRDDMMYNYVDASDTIEEAADKLAEYDWKNILKLFPFLKPIPTHTAADPQTEIIAYRVGLRLYEDSKELDEDFHFRVRRNGVWYEKQGTQTPHECYDQNIEGKWMTPNGDLEYNSCTYYAIIEN